MKAPRKATERDARHYLRLAFRDYVGARRMLLTGLPLQGSQLASTAVEKYSKCMLALEGHLTGFHLDDLKRFRSALTKHGVDVLDGLDPVFLDVLSKAYQLRYYDRVQGPMPFSFLSLQLLAELDGFVASVEQALEEVQRDDGVEPYRTDYRQSIEAKEPDVWEENFVLAGTSKNAFMERESGGIAFSFLPDGEDLLVTIKRGMRVEKYEGRMLTIAEPIAVSQNQVNVPFAAAISTGSSP